MRPIPATPRLLAVAERVVWFETPQAALAAPRRFLAHVMTYGAAEDVAAVREALPAEAFREVLDDPPPGVFDARSWAYWHLVVNGASPPPPLPERSIPGAALGEARSDRRPARLRRPRGR